MGRLTPPLETVWSRTKGGQECPPHTNCRASLGLDGRGRPSLHDQLRSFTPAGQVLFLLGGQTVDLDAHRLELQLGYALVEFRWNRVDLAFERGVVLHHVLEAESL